MKNNEPLGATAKIGDDGSLTVARIIKGGAADRSGLIHINDRIIEVNGIRAKKSNVEVRMRFKLYEMDLKMAQKDCERDRSRDKICILYAAYRYQNSPIICFPFELGHFGVCSLYHITYMISQISKWPNSKGKHIIGLF